MLTAIYSTFYSKKRLKNHFLAIPKKISSFSLSVNESPVYGRYSSKYTFIDDGINYGVDYQCSDKEASFQINKNNMVKLFKDQRYHNHDFIKKIEMKKGLVIDSMIKNFILSLDTFTPLPNPGEEKVLEWLRVSLEVLKNAISRIDQIDSILQYKIFFDKSSVRIIAYNIDINLKIIENRIIFKAFNYKDDMVKNSAPIYNVEIKAAYNDFFNHFIDLLSTLKKKEASLLF